MQKQAADRTNRKMKEGERERDQRDKTPPRNYGDRGIEKGGTGCLRIVTKKV